MTAALGIIHNIKDNTQKIFGGGRVANIAKNMADDENAHTDDILSLSVAADKSVVVSG